MADIAKFESVSIENLAKIWGVSIDNLKSIVGGVVSTNIRTLSSATPVVFESANSSNIMICQMDSTHAIVCYTDVGNSSTGTVCCLTLNGATITAQTPIALSDPVTSYKAGIQDICRLSTTLAIISVRDVSFRNSGYCCCLTLSGSSISVGSYTQYETGRVFSTPRLLSLTTTSAIVVFSDFEDTAKPKASYLTVSGTTITATSPITIDSTVTSSPYGLIDIRYMDSTHFIAIYLDQSNLPKAACVLLSAGSLSVGTPVFLESTGSFYIWEMTYSYSGRNTQTCSVSSTQLVCTYNNATTGIGYIKCLTLSGTTITAGTAIDTGALPAHVRHIIKLTPTTLLFVYAFYGAGYAFIINISGSTLTKNTETRVFSGSSQMGYSSISLVSSSDAVIFYNDKAFPITISGTSVSGGAEITYAAGTPSSICSMDGDHIISVYPNASSSNYGTACCITVNGLTMSVNTPTTFESAATHSINCCLMDSSNAIVVYGDGGNSNYLTACCLTINGTTVVANTPVVVYTVAASWTSMCKMDSSTAIVMNGGRAYCLKLSGTTITSTPPTTIASTGEITNICSMDSTHALVTERIYEVNRYIGYVYCLTLSGTTITKGTPVSFAPFCAYGTNYGGAIESLSSTLALISFSDSSNATRLTSVCITLSGSTVSAGAVSVYTSAVESATATYVKIVPLTSSSAIIASINFWPVFISGTTISYGNHTLATSIINSSYSISAVKIADGVIAISYINFSAQSCTLCILLKENTCVLCSPYTYNAVLTSPYSLVKITNTYLLIAYRDSANTYGKAVVLTLV